MNELDGPTGTETPPERRPERPGPGMASLLLGAILIILGIVFLFAQLMGQFLGIQLARYFWPLFILVPGALLFLGAFVAGRQTGHPLVIVGSVVSMTGALLFYQNITGHWQSWAYAWALVAPTSIGLGQMVYGAARRQPDLVRLGTRLVVIGGAIFLVGAFFFELIVGISGFGLGGFGWPLLLIGLGVIWLLATFMRMRRRV
jgi:hypothetical protein